MNQVLDLALLYKTALRIRLIESRIAEKYSEGNMRCPVHLSIGQEIPSAIFQQLVKPGDTAISTHRAHAHYLAMGGNLPRMIAEIFGKVTGCSKGRGGSMHLIDLEKGFLGSSAIVGNSIPIGVGVGYAKQLDKNPGVSFIFLGDGATEEGSFFESANFAAVHKLPVVFVLENNLYSVYTGLSPRQPENRSMTSLASAIGLKCETAEDSDFTDTFLKLSSITQYAREGYGPCLVEIKTYRRLEHCGPNDDDNLGYRPNHELSKLKDIDLIAKLEKLLELSIEENDVIVANIQSEIEKAFDFADSSPFPSYAEVIGDVYAK
jgi:TPP-dependent pyruvate/acetoin dehydrogenase alpha subunit